MQAHCSICEAGPGGPELCARCAGLLRWVRGYFAHVPGLPSEVLPETRFVEDLGVESLDWMCWPLEAEEKLGVVLPDRQLERLQTVGQFLRALREAGAEWPKARICDLSRRVGGGMLIAGRSSSGPRVNRPAASPPDVALQRTPARPDGLW